MPEKKSQTLLTPVQPTLLSEVLPNDLGSLRARRSSRTVQDLSAVSLVIEHEAAERVLRWSFEKYVKNLSETLVRQCLLAAHQELAGHKFSITTIQDTYYGLEEFFRLCEDKVGGDRAVENVAGIGHQLGKDFFSWYLQNYPGRSVNRKRYGKVKQLLTNYKKRYLGVESVGGVLVWPRAPREAASPTPGYAGDSFNLLAEASLSDIKMIMAEMSTYEYVLKNVSGILQRAPTLADACFEVGLSEYKQKARNKVPKFFSDRVALIKNRAIVRSICIAYKMTADEFIGCYLEHGEALSMSGTLFPSYTIISGNPVARFSGMGVQESWDIASVTIARHHPEWPLDMNWEKASSLISAESRRDLHKDVLSAYKIAVHMRFGKEEQPLEIGLLGYIARFFFTSSTLYPFLLYVQNNTGWNLEAVFAISSNLNDHIAPDLVDPNYVMIYAWKGRSEKSVHHRSNINNPYSVYNVLKFVERVVNKFPIIEGERLESIWQYVRSKNLWTKFSAARAELIASAIPGTSQNFLDRHGIILDARKMYQAVGARRMRTTVQTRRRESGYTLDQSKVQMGHQHIETTLRHYDNDEGGIDLKNIRLRAVQGELVSDLAAYASRLIQDTSLQQLRQAIDEGRVVRSITISGERLTKENVVHLLSPASQTYIAACVDRLNPTWPRHEEFVSKKDPCSFFNKCGLCEQARIFSEALPFIFSRIRDLDQYRISMATLDWIDNFGDEYDAWSGIVSDWNNKEQCARAERLSFNTIYSLPGSLRGSN